MILKNSELKEYLARNFAGEMEALLQASCEPVGIRINPLRTDLLKQKNKFLKWGVAFQGLSYFNNGLLIPDDRLPLSQTLDHFLGRIQYQGLSSQLPPIVLDPQPGETVLDMAAAPGSKSTQIAAMMNNTGRLYLNDINRRRLQPLNTNLQRAGVMNQIVLNLPGERLGALFPNFFDRVLLDAPCTALGTLHQNFEIDLWWSYNKLDKLCALQSRLLIAAYKALKPGGVLVYSTCSIGREENEKNIEQLIAAYPLRVESITEIKAGLFDRGLTTKVKSALRTFPHKHNMEGFFLVKLRKVGEHPYIIDYKKAKFAPTLTCEDKNLRPELEIISQEWGIPFELWADYRFVLTKSRIWLLDKNIKEIPQNGFTSAGLLLTERKSSSWKLLNQSVQYFSRYVSRRIEIDERQLKTLFGAGRLKTTGIKNWYHTLCYRGEPIASVYCHDDILQIRLPHFYTLPEL